MRQQVLDEFAAAEGVVWAGILSGEGFIHEAAGTDSSNLEGVGSLAPSMLDAADALQRRAVKFDGAPYINCTLGILYFLGDVYVSN